jgi:hypothetical protein
MPGKDSKRLRGEVHEGRSPSLGAAKRPCCDAAASSPFTCREADK